MERLKKEGWRRERWGWKRWGGEDGRGKAYGKSVGGLYSSKNFSKKPCC